MKFIRQLIIVLTLILPSSGISQTVIPLYDDNLQQDSQEFTREDAVVGTLVYSVSLPTITAYFPDKELMNGASVIICPGGGYEMLLINREGVDVAKAFNKIGVTAFVLKYRLPDNKCAVKQSTYPLTDAQKAILTVRDSACNWNLNPDKIGIMGFSAGGHLASTAGTHFNTPFVDNNKKLSLRPDFMILINPVVSFKDSLVHIGSKKKLLGHDFTEEEVIFFSNELHVNCMTPPTFISHAKDDNVVPIENSRLFFEQLEKNKVPVELKEYEYGGHGYLNGPEFNVWFSDCVNWMVKKGIISTEYRLRKRCESTDY